MVCSTYLVCNQHPPEIADRLLQPGLPTVAVPLDRLLGSLDKSNSRLCAFFHFIGSAWLSNELKWACTAESNDVVTQYAAKYQNMTIASIIQEVALGKDRELYMGGIYTPWRQYMGITHLNDSIDFIGLIHSSNRRLFKPLESPTRQCFQA
jgi:hypothetical protein